MVPGDDDDFGRPEKGKLVMWQMVTIDPGAKDTALAVWQMRRLMGCGVVENGDGLQERTTDITMLYVPEICYVEDQYVDKRSAVRAKDLVDVAFWAGAAAVASRAPRIERVPASTWKGQMDKGPCCLATWKRLDERERDIVKKAVARFTKKPWAKIMQAIEENRLGAYDVKRVTDLLDSVGIGLYFGRRF